MKHNVSNNTKDLGLTFQPCTVSLRQPRAEPALACCYALTRPSTGFASPSEVWKCVCCKVHKNISLSTKQTLVHVWLRDSTEIKLYFFSLHIQNTKWFKFKLLRNFVSTYCTSWYFWSVFLVCYIFVHKVKP